MPKLSKPLIGITAPENRAWVAQIFIALSVWITGGRAVRLTAKNPKWEKIIDGLIVGGGTDIFPAIYQYDPDPATVYDRPRDEMEMGWLRRAEEQDLPVLGICRGAQMMNVERGGSLHPQVSEAYEDAHYPTHLLAKIFYRKRIAIKPGSLLERIIGQEFVMVNSMHKQAVARPGRNLEVTAVEENKVIQAIEDSSKAFYLGVQFHPEFLIYRCSFRRLFSELVRRAGERRVKRP